ncbi:MAG: carbohydrate ABC transporter permease [Lachnospiraceae bacterium]|nr:carbohydrate ABC transporter permease [Lachnospiraceae bacterium]
MSDRYSKVFRIALYVISAITCLVILYPYLVMFFSSVKGMNEIYRIPGTLWPEKWNLSNYRTIWEHIPLTYYFRNSAIVACGATALSITCAIPTGYALARMSFPGKKGFMQFIIITQMFAPVVLLVGIYRIMLTLHLTNNLFGLILLIAAFNQAFSSWLLSGTFATISKELEEAATIDGCSRLQAVIRVIIPLAAPGIVTAVIHAFIGAWNEYTLTLVLISDTYKKSLNVGIRAFFGYTNIEWWYVFTASLLTTIPILFLFQAIDKYIVGGLTAGGVKG